LFSVNENFLMGQREAHLNSVTASLSRLDWRRQVAFGLLVFERLLPLLTVFCKARKQDVSCFLRARDAVYRALRNSDCETVDPGLRDECFRNIPDTEDFSHERTSDALNAGLTMTEILDFIKDRRPEHISYLAGLALDSADFYAMSTLEPFDGYTPEIKRKIVTHPAVQGEMSRQHHDLRFLAALPDGIDEDGFEAIKARATAQAPVRPVA
jgi:uncharacterized protein YjaG (DUF416 family)